MVRLCFYEHDQIDVIVTRRLEGVQQYASISSDLDSLTSETCLGSTTEFRVDVGRHITIGDEPLCSLDDCIFYIVD